uniref:CHK domain-containing protein n=1 Tax=Anopheles dirus TaxID=7168 RepID=A0A182NEB7_9DIPT
MESTYNIISIQDCIQIVKADRNISDTVVKIITHELQPIPGQPGYLGEYYYLNISFQTENGSTASGRYFMKSLPYHDSVLTKAVEEWGIFRKEAELYEQLFNRYDRAPNRVIKWLPKCVLTRSNVLVLEDLTRAGFETASFQISLNEQHMKVIFDRLAQMHACSFQFELDHLGGKTIGSLFHKEILFETTFTVTSGWFVAGLKGIRKVALERNHHSKDPAKQSMIENELWSCMERIYSLAENTDEFRSVVVHRDLWVNNIMFKYDLTDTLRKSPKDCVLIDFQLARYLPPCVDYLCALYLLTDREHRKQHEEMYVEYYYQSLQAKLNAFDIDGSAVLSKEQFKRSLNHYRLVGLVWAGVLHGFVNFPKGVLDKLHQEDPHTYTRMSMEDRDDFVLAYYDSDHFYRQRLDDVVTESSVAE